MPMPGYRVTHAYSNQVNHYSIIRKADTGRGTPSSEAAGTSQARTLGILLRRLSWHSSMPWAISSPHTMGGPLPLDG
jgi:hypothetical protein